MEKENINYLRAFLGINSIFFKVIVGRIFNTIFYFCLLFIIFLILQIFFVSSFHIPSDSMEPSLCEGDYILVNKLIQGARIFNINAALNHKTFKIHRLHGYSKINYNDILVFNFPYSKSSWDSISFDIMRYYVKRCIALPSDTLEIENGIYKVKNMDIPLGNIESQINIINYPDSSQFVEMVSYPFNKSMNWTIKNFGPLSIPYKEQIIPWIPLHIFFIIS